MENERLMNFIYKKNLTTKLNLKVLQLPFFKTMKILLCHLTEKSKNNLIKINFQACMSLIKWFQILDLFSESKVFCDLWSKTCVLLFSSSLHKRNFEQKLFSAFMVSMGFSPEPWFWMEKNL